MNDPLAEELGDVPDDLAGRVKPELHAGERLLWVGRGRVRSPGPVGVGNPFIGPLWSIGLLGVGVLFLAARFGAFGRHFVFEPTDAGALLMFGLIGVLGGVLTAAGTVAGRALRRKQRERLPRERLYALTDRRALVWRPRDDSEAVEVHSLPRGLFSNAHRVEYPDGSGDVVFECSEEQWWLPCHFEGVDEVRRVELLVRRFLIDPDAGAPRVSPADDPS